MSDWLVPVSPHVRYEQASGRAIPGRFDELQAAALEGKLVSVVCERASM